MSALFLEPHLRTDQKVCFGLQSHTCEQFALGYSLTHVNGLLWVTVSYMCMVCFGLQSHTYEWLALGYSLTHMNHSAPQQSTQAVKINTCLYQLHQRQN
jgi:hypothetical protein